MNLILVAAAVALLSVQAASAAEKASANLAGPDGTDRGTVTLTQTPHGVLVQADLKGLAPGAHGFHIHTTGSCDPDFKAASGHFNPKGSGHGFTHEGGFHAGDMPNVHAGADGAVRADVFNASVTLTDGDATLFDADGAAIVVHENADSYGESAGAGARVACGVIRRK